MVYHLYLPHRTIFHNQNKLSINDQFLFPGFSKEKIKYQEGRDYPKQQGSEC
jgi:hypothetical protein